MLRPLVFAAAMLMVSSCAPADAPVAAASGTPGQSTATRVPSPQKTMKILDSLPECQDDPAPVELGEIAGLVAPPETVTLARTDQGGLTTVEGVIARTPIEVRQWYEYETLGTLKPMMIEDEILEAEALMQGRGYRLYIKAQARCRGMSDLWVVISQGEEPVPVPGSTDAPGSPPPSG